jgi:hypothetical protein
MNYEWGLSIKIQITFLKDDPLPSPVGEGLGLPAEGQRRQG